MKRGKILIYIALFFLAMPLGLLGLTVRADEVSTEVTTIVIHKRVFLDSNAEAELRVNNGIELDESNDLANPQKTFGLNGAVFEVYDATEYITRLQADYSDEEIEQAVLDADLDSLRAELTEGNKLGEVTTGTLDGEVGIATISIENLTDQTMLIILEKAGLPANTTIRSIAAPMLISFPVANPDTNGEEAFLSTVHLYPKSILRSRLPQTGGKTPPPTTTPVRPVTPKPTGRLPQTGEAKSMIGLFGLVIVGTVSIIWFKRNSNKKTH
ncbi:pilin N-terminal domain-containing protein [Enterococcus sp.]|uniref:pilin N-terminal domain-containing protein n=1 Tax=Enterococcus sp. TaxID=35783 RepID=UPI002FC8FE6E